MGFETSLRLTSGADVHLRALAALATIGGIIAALLSPAGIYLTAVFCSACILVFLLLSLCDHTHRRTQLLLTAEGHAQWLDKQSECSEGQMMMNAWSNGRYAVLQIRSSKSTRRFVISRSIQRSGDFRTLLAWLRLGRANVEPEQP